MRREAELLSYQSEPQALRLSRPCYNLNLLVNGDRAAVRLLDAHENLDERAFARAVFAAKPTNFPRAEGE
jgi:hypothetical protein